MKAISLPTPLIADVRQFIDPARQRHLARFPQDFMCQLSADEFKVLRSQTVTSNTGRGGRRTAPQRPGHDHALHKQINHDK